MFDRMGSSVMVEEEALVAPGRLREEWAKRRGYASAILLGLCALAYCWYILSLPVFPTQDGPVHLYFTRIMQALMFHRDPGLFPQYFFIKHLLPPYALYYYLLLILGHFVPLVMADKLVICLYIVLFLFGFRFLARSLGPSGDAMALLVVPFALNWQLGMGFVNFCLSIALGLWALGLWCRVAQQPEARTNGLRLAGFVALSFVIVLTHPVPLICVLGFCVVELSVRLRRFRRSGGRGIPKLLRRDATVFVLACTTLIYVKAFTTHDIVQQLDPEHRTYLQGTEYIARGILVLGTTDLFSPHSVLSEMRRGLLYLVVLTALVLGAIHLRRSLKQREWTLSDTWFAVAVVWGIAVPLMPPDMNSAHLFSARLMIFAVLAALAGGSGGKLPATSRGLICCALAMAVSLAVTLRDAVKVINPIAWQMADLETRRPGEAPSVFLAIPTAHYDRPVRTITFDPFLWSPLRVVRRSDSILYNTPWLNQPHLPIGSEAVMLTGRLDQNTLEAPSLLRRRMLESSAIRTMVFAPADRVIINHGSGPALTGLDPLLELDPAASQAWTCDPEEFLTVCSRGPKKD